MKILQVIPYFTPKRGGDVNVCYNVAQGLSNLGHDVTVLTTDFEYDENFARSMDKKIDIIQFRSMFNFNLFIYSPDMDKWLRNNIRNYDVVHLHSLRSYQNNLVYKYASEFSIPYVIQPHGSTSRKIGKKSFKILYDIFYGKKIIKNANRVIAVSKEESMYDNEMGAESKNIKIIYNGLNLTKYEVLPEKDTFKNKYSIDKSVILYLGRIHKLKGIDFLIKSFNDLVKDLDVVLVIAGSDDGYKSELQKLIFKYDLNDKVIFTGFLDENDKISALRDADLFVHAVEYMGGVGLIPLEAILCETPVIVTEGCGEVIKEINCGYFVEYGNIKDLKDTMEKILKNPEDGKMLTSKGKKFIKEKFNWDEVVITVEKTLKEAVSGE